MKRMQWAYGYDSVCVGGETDDTLDRTVLDQVLHSRGVEVKFDSEAFYMKSAQVTDEDIAVCRAESRKAREWWAAEMNSRKRCKRCKSWDGNFTTRAGGDICDDCV
jgi:hypothetical protein